MVHPMGIGTENPMDRDYIIMLPWLIVTRWVIITQWIMIPNGVMIDDAESAPG